MKLDFRIDFGYQYLYSRRHYHPQFVWDGKLTVEGGHIEKTYQLTYPVLWFGPGHSAVETELEGPAWTLRTKRGLAGIRFEADVDENAVFHLDTVYLKADFTAQDILEKGRIEYMVGPKYLTCSAIVTRTGYLWYHNELHEGETAIEAADMGLPMHNWHRMILAFLEPGAGFKFEVEIPEKTHDYEETLFHTLAMPSRGYTEGGPNTKVNSFIKTALYADGKLLKEVTKYYRVHDNCMQILEDDWIRVQLAPGKHEIELRNNDGFWFCLNRITYRQCGYNHGQLSMPEWALKNEELTARVYAVKNDTITIENAENNITVNCVPGWNEFKFSCANPGNAVFANGEQTAVVEIIDAVPEKEPVRVGYDMTVVPHDDNGFMDWLLDYTQRTRLGNYVVFRSFFEGPASDKSLARWGAFCRDHGLWVSAASEFMSGALIKAAGDMFSDCGQHEYPGRVYACDPKTPWASEDMKEAYEHYLKYLKMEIDKVHTVAPVTAFGDASGGIRHNVLAGADFVRAETMVGNTMTLLSQARPAAEALGKGRWGVHIAIQHNFQPYHENHLGQYFLSLMQPWMMGCNTMYEEDSLFELFKEERQAWDDQLTKGKRDMTRSFFKFVSSHPRRGKNVRNIAFLEGRYAAPFNGFICDVEQDPHYAVWGLFGKNAPEWGHAQPEKCRQVLDVLMPGACTHPFRQHFDKRRMFFAGTPYGDFDCVPVEASADYLQGYKLIANLGWHTANEEDEKKLTAFVENGGTLLTGIPQFSTHIGREFLKDMDDLSLIRGGDLSELCGIKVLGRGEEYSGQWNCSGREKYEEPVLSALPSDCVTEDGKACLADIELAGAEVVAWDAFTAQPMLVRKKVGKGYVYTFTLWAYPGHEMFMKFSATVLKALAAEALPDISVTDESGEVFWTRWVDGDTTILMLLNTDWTAKGNVKPVTVNYGYAPLHVDVKEREALVITIKDRSVSAKRYTL